MGAVKMTGVSDLLCGNRREMHFENDDYDLTVYIGFIDSADPVDLDLILGTRFRSKREGFPEELVCGIKRVQIAAYPAVGYSMPAMSRYNGKDRSADEGIRSAQAFLDRLDELIRKEYPGYGVIPRREEQENADIEQIYGDIERKTEQYYGCPKEKTLKELLSERFMAVPQENPEPEEQAQHDGGD